MKSSILAVDSMTFDNGRTEILLSDGKKKNPTKARIPRRRICVQHAYKTVYERKSGNVAATTTT